ncbi:hypothetical protein PBT90_05700 [Algoriphagus halophytocola]|uniref:Beta-lactamase-inhibitor-like PepSY-like domain-containing protein n=1 Tax=Algoriphagus halophytocola TaxID=2991499 RepID=A0ABY6MGJ7_9BACT|nr:MULTISPECIES: hypothetical protein [unclassified Algoriphagus]UZD22911.1 hypothetical protein OM944_00150 [Algoriphagus sp. TR-M5]WBL44179.1 hypothetical protein PBT90_05700 [Algoriphagus sp. TR-M9]
MKTQYIIYPAMVAMLSTACGKSNVNEQGIEAQNEMSTELNGDDTTMVKRDGTLLSGTLDEADSTRLPAPVINAIENDEVLSKSRIISTSSKIENSITVYEVEFELSDQSNKTVEFLENGNVRQ